MLQILDFFYHLLYLNCECGLLKKKDFLTCSLQVMCLNVGAHILRESSSSERVNYSLLDYLRGNGIKQPC